MANLQVVISNADLLLWNPYKMLVRLLQALFQCLYLPIDKALSILVSLWSLQCQILIVSHTFLCMMIYFGLPVVKVSLSIHFKIRILYLIYTHSGSEMATCTPSLTLEQLKFSCQNPYSMLTSSMSQKEDTMLKPEQHILSASRISQLCTSCLTTLGWLLIHLTMYLKIHNNQAACSGLLKELSHLP